jgi:hypothetical protein
VEPENDVLFVLELSTSPPRDQSLQGDGPTRNLGHIHDHDLCSAFRQISKRAEIACDGFGAVIDARNLTPARHTQNGIVREQRPRRVNVSLD